MSEYGFFIRFSSLFNFNLTLIKDLTTWILFSKIHNMKSLHFSSVYYTGTLTQAVVRDLTSTVYYFKLRACTNAGKGPPSDVVKVVLNPCIRPCDGGNSSPPICKLATAPDLFTSSPFLWPHFMDLEFWGGKGYMI